ncbi:MAG: DUF1499 domain-containing protein [Paracoccaceae bacterium]
MFTKIGPGLIAIAIVVALVVVAFIRFTPNPPAKWHVAPDFTGNKNMKSGVVRVVDGDSDRFAQLAAIIRATPRTLPLAGSLDEQMVTFVTRTKVFGFPDFTTLQLRDGKIIVYARLRFGRSDLGVNRDRVERWLGLLQAG